ncbi:hypothetical protein Thal_1457 [Thermocrinis albus DSM 14484]|uniref:Uncharacterized protein n=1 Tax=Thermocrinis albus (strain DSM 14484 / JCM 11386 / HI 11/12) TaxID=638303 RepID=D3SMV6_THEAH|nr:hypothetical protein [Thermocrinis albus]ADC90086.1 hypothetical protein Thal_1457 [Thermocrinis albus DSM 14484]
MQGLKSIVEAIDLIMSAHALYISKLERAIRDKAPFEHKGR